MCGIVGYVGEQSVVDILLDGLEQLEYRGYDSAGVALQTPDKLDVYKAVGKLCNLREELKHHTDETRKAIMGIGHIRWATHGAPTLLNAHPHSCNCGNLVVVHNGIIENYKELRELLTSKGCVFKTQTDTEVVAHLVAQKYAQTKDLTEAVRLATKDLKGAYALCVMHKEEKHKLVGTKLNAPLLIGVGDGENFFASDVPAIIKHTKKAIYLEDGEIATLTKESYSVIDGDGNTITKKIEMLPWEPIALSKMGYNITFRNSFQTFCVRIISYIVCIFIVVKRRIVFAFPCTITTKSHFHITNQCLTIADNEYTDSISFIERSSIFCICYT